MCALHEINSKCDIKYPPHEGINSGLLWFGLGAKINGLSLGTKCKWLGKENNR